MDSSQSDTSIESELDRQSDKFPHQEAYENKIHSDETRFQASSNLRSQAPEDVPLLDEGHEDGGIFSRRDSDEFNEPAGRGEPSKSRTYLVLLTLAMAGLQVAWAVELSSISPFLLELGLSKALLAFVWIAGPLSGTLAQPYVGIKSDNCRYKRGRRRPFMVGGAAATICSLLLLSWTREIISTFLGIFGASEDSRGVVICCQMWAVLFVYVLDFAINAIQAGVRAFIVDCAPTHQQESANAIAGIINGIGGIIGYFFGEVDLSESLSFLGRSQFQVQCAIASIAMAVTLAISCSTVKEPDPWSFGPPSRSDAGVIAFFKTMFRSIRALPIQIKRVCLVQIFLWIGFFPFLIYVTTYVGYLYADPKFAANPEMSEEEVNEVFEDGTRLGTYALFIYSIISLAASIVLPCIVVPTYGEPQTETNAPMRTGSTASLNDSDRAEANGVAKTNSIRSMQSRILSIFNSISIRIPGLTLRRAWLLSHLLLAGLMWTTLFIRTTTAATIMISLVGIPWAFANWAPFALIAAEISKRNAIRHGLRAPPPTEEGQRLAQSRVEEPAEQAGIVLGIHNVAVSAPQVISTLISSIIFKLLQKPRGVPGDDSVGWVLRFGGLSALAAAWFTRNVSEGD